MSVPVPFVKWAGGKQSLATTIISIFPSPSTVDTYYEPFLGGGSIFFSYAPGKAVLNDSNQWLIDTYRAIREDWARVAELLEPMPNTKEDYLRIRSQDPWSMDLYNRAAMFIYLNKTCFRGLFRVNRKGQFNVPWGAYDRRYFDPENLRAVSEVLKTVELRSTDFELALHDIDESDFVYFDPPYHPLGGYSDFKRYTPDQFREHDHIRLACLCRDLDRQGVRWVVSNSDTPFVRELYKDYLVYEINARREINLDSTKRDVKELIITNMTVEAPQKEVEQVEQILLF